MPQYSISFFNSLLSPEQRPDLALEGPLVLHALLQDLLARALGLRVQKLGASGIFRTGAKNISNTAIPVRNFPVPDFFTFQPNFAIL